MNSSCWNVYVLSEVKVSLEVKVLHNNHLSEDMTNLWLYKNKSREQEAVFILSVQQSVKKYPCRHCEQSFNSRNGLRRHNRTTHDGKKRTYTCWWVDCAARTHQNACPGFNEVAVISVAGWTLQVLHREQDHICHQRDVEESHEANARNQKSWPWADGKNFQTGLKKGFGKGSYGGQRLLAVGDRF